MISRIDIHKTITLILLFSFACLLAQTNIENLGGYQDGYDYGETYGKNTNQRSWFARGIVGSLLFNVIGGGIVIGGAGRENVNIPDSIIPINNLEYRNGFIEGYKNGVRKERVSSALFGAAIGVTINTIVIVLVAHNALTD